MPVITLDNYQQFQDPRPEDGTFLFGALESDSPDLQFQATNSSWEETLDWTVRCLWASGCRNFFYRPRGLVWVSTNPIDFGEESYRPVYQLEDSPIIGMQEGDPLPVYILVRDSNNDGGRMRAIIHLCMDNDFRPQINFTEKEIRRRHGASSSRNDLDPDPTEPLPFEEPEEEE